MADSAVDQFRFILEVDHTVQCVCQCVGECIGMDGCVCVLGYCQCKGFVVLHALYILFSLVQITNVGDSSLPPIELSESVSSCGAGECSVPVVLRSGERGVEDGTTYVVSARAVNRYGQSEASGNSDPFTIEEDTATPSNDVMLAVCLCVCVCVCMCTCVVHTFSCVSAVYRCSGKPIQ